MWAVICLFIGFILGFWFAVSGQIASEDSAVKNGVVRLRSEGKAKYYTIKEIKINDML